MSNLVSETLDDNARKAAAQKAINRTLIKYIGIKVGVTLAVAGAIIVVNKIIENKMQTETPAE